LSKLPEYLDPNFKKHCILILPGSFCPIHLNHIRTLELVKSFLQEKLDYEVIGGMLVPTHDIALRKKNNGMNPVSNKHRKALIELDLDESDWIMAYTPFMDS
jgi:nicotinic acid mononucleotide adenylyltransferase